MIYVLFVEKVVDVRSKLKQFFKPFSKGNNDTKFVRRMIDSLLCSWSFLADTLL